VITEKAALLSSFQVVKVASRATYPATAARHATIPSAATATTTAYE